MLAGYTRLTYSLIIIMLETTTSINLFIPLMIGIMMSRGVSGLFTRSLYERALRTKQMPVLRGSIPKVNQFMKVEHMMEHNVITTNSVCKVSEARRLLETSHAAWPIFNLAGNLCGLIGRSVLIRLIAQKAWYKHNTDALERGMNNLRSSVMGAGDSINPSPHHNSINREPDMPEDFDDDKEDKPFEPVNVINTGIESTDKLIQDQDALE